jgi:hypothetical protein
MSQSMEEMALKFSIGLLYIIPEGRRRCYHRSTGYQRFHARAYEYTVGCFCTATARHHLLSSTYETSNDAHVTSWHTHTCIKTHTGLNPWESC